MSKHTPGPWSYSTHSDGWHYTINIHQADGAPFTPDWSDVAFCTCRGERQEVQEANARLIAAAPDLLAALQAYMSAGVGNSTHFELQGKACKMALDAIAKATGEQQ